jgi:hypothetical protein
MARIIGDPSAAKMLDDPIGKHTLAVVAPINLTARRRVIIDAQSMTKSALDNSRRKKIDCLFISKAGRGKKKTPNAEHRDEGILGFALGATSSGRETEFQE